MPGRSPSTRKVDKGAPLDLPDLTAALDWRMWTKLPDSGVYPVAGPNEHGWGEIRAL
jgi:hypothetical protein